jgi:hypothetical protein
MPGGWQLQLVSGSSIFFLSFSNRVMLFSTANYDRIGFKISFIKIVPFLLTVYTNISTFSTTTPAYLALPGLLR